MKSRNWRKWILVIWLAGILAPIAGLRQFSMEFRRAFDALFAPNWMHVIMHAILFAGLVVLISLAFKVHLTIKKAGGMLLAVLTVGLVQELIQAANTGILWPGGIFYDLGVDLAGGAAGILLMAGFQRLRSEQLNSVDDQG